MAPGSCFLASCAKCAPKRFRHPAFGFWMVRKAEQNGEKKRKSKFVFVDIRYCHICPKNMMELKQLDSWEVTVGTTSLGTSAESIRLSLGAADISAESGAIVPRRNLLQSDFSDIWWVGDRADYGLVVARIMNALSTEGFSYKTTDKGKGQNSITLTGHVSIKAQDVVPVEFYSLDPVEVWGEEAGGGTETGSEGV